MITLRTAALATVLALSALQPAAASDEALIGQPFDKVVEAARGGTVHFFMWGGADPINAYVSETLGSALSERYGITLERVPVTDAAEVVNLILGEKEAGVTDKGAVDLIWINGENFRSMRQADLAFCGYTDSLPNNRLIDWSDPSIAYDFGIPVDGCEVPWNRVQFAFAHDSARTPEPPRSIPDLLAWIKANPGRFTYPAPPDFNGSAFVRHVFYHAAGGVEALLGPFDQATFDAVAPKAWALLNEIEPALWRAGETYPTSIVQHRDLFANGEIDITFDYDPAQFGIAVDAGLFPPTVRSYGLEDGTIGNTNYVLIPFNSPNKAAAMVLADLMLSGEMQYEKARPEVWGAAPAIVVDRLPAELAARFKALPRHPSVVAPEAIADKALPELSADWIDAIEDGWRQSVGR